MEYTTENMDKLMAWVNEGNRSLKVEFKKYYTNKIQQDVFCYDYDLSDGSIIKNISDLPDKKTLRKKRIERLERELAAEKKAVA